MKFRTFLYRYHLSLIWAGIILFLSLAKFSNLPETMNVTWSDKLVHVAMYAFFSFVMLAENEVLTRKSLFAVGVLACSLGGLMEIAQSYTDYRSGDWRDMIANTIGTILGVFISWLVVSFWQRKQLPSLKFWVRNINPESV
ncbi:MAG: hypothetical protein RIS47_1039 [Bacteroidota bacterium]|jgi:VanZ family protein